MSLVTSALHRFIDLQNHPQSGTITRSIALVSVVAALWYATRPEYDTAAPLVPYSYPLLGSTKEYRKDPQAFVEKWTAEYGPVFRVHIHGRIHTVVSEHYVREVFLNTDFNFVTAISKTFDALLLLGTSPEDISVAAFRHVIMKHLATKMKSYTPRVVEHLSLARQDFLGDLNEPVELDHLYPMIQHMISTAGASIFAGVHLAKNEDLVWVFKNLVLDVGKHLGPTNWFLDAFPSINRLRMWYIGKFSSTILKYKNTLRDALKPEVARRRAGAKLGSGWDRPDDILQDLLDGVVSEDDPNELDLLAKWLNQLVFVAIHTTSENSTIVLYRIMDNPDVVRVLLEEQDEVLERHYGPDFKELYKKSAGQLFTSEVIKEFHKLDSVCREALRFKNDYLALPHSNIGKKPVVLSNGAVIKPGHDVLINLWTNHRTKEVQRDSVGQHNQFKPFRFVGLDRQSTKVGDDFLVFGQGKHACPGRWFALQEMKTIISVLIRDCKLTPLEPIVFPTTDAFFLPSGRVRFEKK